MTAYIGPPLREDDRPLCRTAPCAEFGIRAESGGLCRECREAARYDAEEERGVDRWRGLAALTFTAIFALTACATAPTAAGIARDLDRQLTVLADWPLSVRCQAVTDAERRCERAGLPRKCFADGWVDADRDHFSIAACLKRQAREAKRTVTPSRSPPAAGGPHE